MSKNRMKPTVRVPMTDSTRASMAVGRASERRATARVQPPMMRVHSKKEPS